MNLLGGFPVLAHVGVHIYPIRATAIRFFTAHGRANAELPSLVTARSDHATLAWERTDDEGLSRKIGVVPYFYGGIERIHIYMDDSAWSLIGV